jgi:hypothetical protein
LPVINFIRNPDRCPARLHDARPFSPLQINPIQPIKGKDCHFRKILPLKIGFAPAQTIDGVFISVFFGRQPNFYYSFLFQLHKKFGGEQERHFSGSTDLY